MKKIVSFVLILCVLLGMAGCGSKVKITQKLEAGDYQAAYDIATDVKMRQDIIAENFLALFCNDVNLNTDSEVKLIHGWFGQAQASEADAYQPSNPIFAFDNYAKLAEYISLMSGQNVLKEYAYGVGEFDVAGVVVYGIASIEIETGEFNAITSWLSLDLTSDDDNSAALRKYIARYIKENGTSLNEEAVKRINSHYMGDPAAQVEFEFDLSE